MNHYIENKEILLVAQTEDNTPIGNEMVKVTFMDNSSEVMPKARFELLATEEVSDATAARKILVARVSSIIFGTFHEYGIKMGEVNSIIDGITELINNGFTKAQNIKWGSEYTDIGLLDVNKVLLDEQNNNGAPSSGGGADNEDKE